MWHVTGDMWQEKNVKHLAAPHPDILSLDKQFEQFFSYNNIAFLYKLDGVGPVDNRPD